METHDRPKPLKLYTVYKGYEEPYGNTDQPKPLKLDDMNHALKKIAMVLNSP